MIRPFPPLNFTVPDVTPGPPVHYGQLLRVGTYTAEIDSRRAQLPLEEYGKSDLLAVRHLSDSLASDEDGGRMGWTQFTTREQVGSALGLSEQGGIGVFRRLEMRGVVLQQETWRLGPHTIRIRFRVNLHHPAFQNSLNP